LDYPIFYASAKSGWAVKNLKDDKRENVNVLLDGILEHIPSPKVKFIYFLRLIIIIVYKLLFFS
jgi:predicted membrane GTPase involved in stress response